MTGEEDAHPTLRHRNQCSLRVTSVTRATVGGHIIPVTGGVEGALLSTDLHARLQIRTMGEGEEFVVRDPELQSLTGIR